MMAGDMILLPILMDTYQDTRSGSKISGLFSPNEILTETKDEEVLRDYQSKLDDSQAMLDLRYNSHLYPMPDYELAPQDILSNAELDIRRPSVLDEAEWDLGSFDVENIDCGIFAELSDLGTTEGTDEIAQLKPQLPPVASKFSDGRVTRCIKSPPVYESLLVPTASRGVAASNFLDHSYAAVIPKIPAVHPAMENARDATFEEETDDVGKMKVLKTVKYVERRKKNNLASRRSRETRKRKYVEMQEHVFQLEWRNAELRNKVEKMETLSRTMKQLLFGKIDVPDVYIN